MERRSYPRVNLGLPLDIIVKNKYKNNTYNKISGKTLNLSEGGICLAINSPLPETSNLQSTIDFRPHNCQIITDIEIVWYHRVPEQNLFIYGSRFIDLSMEKKIVFRKMLWLYDIYIKDSLLPLLDILGDKIALKEQITEFFTRDVKMCAMEFTRIEQLINILYSKTDELCNSIAQQGQRIVDSIGHKKTTKEIKNLFREMIGNWVYQGQIVKRAFDKPRGYPGDYQMLEEIYNNHILSDGIGGFFDRSFLDNPYAIAVRNRKDKMKYFLSNFIKSVNSGSIKILNLACGSCREIRELLYSLKENDRNIHFTCIDWDEEALNFSKKSLTDIGYNNINIEFIKENILALNENNKFYNQLYNHDLIYSIGIADYIPDRILKLLIQNIFKLLSKNGRFILTHKDKNKYMPLPPNWFCDWEFIPRDEEELMMLVKECIPYSYITVEREPSQKIFFLTIEKD